MSRKPGSGLNKKVSRAIEELTAALFEGSSTAAALEVIRDEERAGRSGVSSRSAHRWVSSIVEQMNLSVRRAELPPTDYLGDVHLTLTDGSSVYVEVKAQTTKKFSELVQADWVKSVTDSLRWLYASDAPFRAAQPPWLADLMHESAPQRYFGSWTFSELWAADVALLTDRNRRLVADVDEPADLTDFLQRKFLLQVSVEGARIVRLDRIPSISSVINGEPVEWWMKHLRKCTGIYIKSIGGQPEKEFDFVYYVGYGPTVIGRHKLHARAVAQANGLIEVK